MDFRFGKVSRISIDGFVKENSVVQLGFPPMRIDIMTSLSGVAFEECYLKKAKAVIDGVESPFIDLESLKVDKSSTNRKQDLGDIENLP